MPRGILQHWRYLSVLSWAEIEELYLGRLGRLLARTDFPDSNDFDFLMQRRSELDILKYRSRSGLLNINAVDPDAFKLLFRFHKEDLDTLYRSLGMPEYVTSAQGVRVAGRQAMCLTLRRLAYPNRWCELEPVFGMHTSVMSSVTSQVISDIVHRFGHLLKDLNNHAWLSEDVWRTSQL
ncbi:hypothetical protein HPB50_007259 [Hyalomma asiaticum]|uniref:Uncharacterized protein n=1 Tax=Hyalomma asiaticum TaxID=266040 RepID=A0ACB7TJU0_HYAAI|nr:hypothetical protein HPB50_007259 [Hyalomma asiaticum]